MRGLRCGTSFADGPVVPVLLGTIVLLAATAADPSAERASGDLFAAEQRRNTARLTVGAAAVMAASYPGSIEDPGPGVVLAKPIWLGRRHRAFQWVFDGSALTSYGASSGHARFSLGARYGFDLLLGSVYAMELRLGSGPALQAGKHTVPGVEPFTFSWAHSFRVTRDDDHRVKIATFMNAGLWLARDRESDMGMSAPVMGIAVAYELPY